MKIRVILAGDPRDGKGSARSPSLRPAFRRAGHGKRAVMEIGEPLRTYTVEPIEDPVPQELPADAPDEEPAERETVPAE